MIDLDEYIIALVLYLKLIAIDMSSVEVFVMNIFDKYVLLADKRSILLKYLQLIIAKILSNDVNKNFVVEKFTKVYY